MSEEPTRLQTPLTREGNGALRTGDLVLLSGVLYTARDAAHARMKEAIGKGEPLPFDPKGQVVYFTGPAPARPGFPLGPAGPTTADLPDTPLEWADFTSQFGDSPTRSGAAVFVAPNHPDYPPTWLTRHYGPLCVGWPGVHAKTFAPGKPIRLGYRLWIHKGAVETAEVQAAYDAYAAALQSQWQ